MRGQPWTDEEDRLVLEKANQPIADVAVELGRSVLALKARRRHLGVAKPKAYEAWTDEELGFLQDHENWSAARIARELGRSWRSVASKRHQLNHGWSRVNEQWTEDEDEFILCSPHMTAKQVADHLGRTEVAVDNRRTRLARECGVTFGNAMHKLPHVIAGRPLLAKTCTACGRLLQADWFGFSTTLRVWTPSCKACAAERDASRPARDRGLNTSAKESRGRLQAATVPYAARARFAWTDDDHVILSDPDLSLLEKALKLERSYNAVATICSRNGYRSHYGLGEPTDLWRIFNPNEPGVAA